MALTTHGILNTMTPNRECIKMSCNYQSVPSSVRSSISLLAPVRCIIYIIYLLFYILFKCNTRIKGVETNHGPGHSLLGVMVFSIPWVVKDFSDFSVVWFLSETWLNRCIRYFDVTYIKWYIIYLLFYILFKCNTRIKGVETNHGPGKVRKKTWKEKKTSQPWIIPFFIEAQISLIKHVTLEEDR
jgi:hypothetical protein